MYKYECHHCDIFKFFRSDINFDIYKRITNLVKKVFNLIRHTSHLKNIKEIKSINEGRVLR